MSKNQQRAFKQRQDAIQSKASKMHMITEHKKRNINRQIGTNVFEEEFEVAEYGPLKYKKKGLKLAPVDIWTLWFIEVIFRVIKYKETSKIEFFSFKFGSFLFSIHNWSLRNKVKPKGVIGNYHIKFEWV